MLKTARRSGTRKGLAGAVIAGIAIVPLVGMSASADAAPGLKVVKTLSTAYLGPLQFAVGHNRVLVADSFTSTLNKIGRSAPLAHGGNPNHGGDISGIAINHRTHAYAFTTTNSQAHTHTTLTIRTPGHRTVVANLSAFERTHNPDHVKVYGVNPGAPINGCVRSFWKKVTGEAPRYRGHVDSHPYAVAALGGGAWAVADAGGNDIVRVDRTGHVSLIAVLPRQKTRITAALAKANGAPSCVVGETYRSESVPTDVEIAPNGDMVVSTLSGGIAKGKVYRFNVKTGHRTLLIKGLAESTNVAVGRKGGVYVAELGTGAVSRINNGRRVHLITLRGLIAIEYYRGHLYASTAPAAAAAEGGPPPSGPPPHGVVVKLGH